MKTEQKVAPFFVGGALHGVKVPPALCSKDLILVGTPAGPQTEYIRNYWWRPLGRGFVFFARDGIDFVDALPIVQRMIKDGAL